MTIKIKVINREDHRLIEEKVYGQWFLKWLYHSPSGQPLAKYFCQKIFTIIYGLFQDFKWSARKIVPFIKDYDIPMEDYLIRGDEDEIKKSYATFNEFFMRKFRHGKRPFVQEKNVFPAFAEGRYLAYEKWSEEISFPVKGKYLRPVDILGDQNVAREFEGGPLIIVRLAPVDYHRFHFPDNGRVMGTYRIAGIFHASTPLALMAKEDVFCTNERQVTLLQTENFGKMAYVEVGALCTGKIVQTYKHPESFHRGEEKGYFLFGGSTVIIFAQKGFLKLDQDLLANTLEGNETLVKLGTRIGSLS